MIRNKKNLLKALGPGILFASTAIGVSHLVQSTKAGAEFGFGLLWAILLANLFKYPFFEYGSRYANATGKSIIDGYQRLGNWALWFYLIITIGSMFFVGAAVGKVTSGFMDNLFGLNILSNNPLMSTLLVFAICGSILLIGKFKILDHLIKLIGSILLISTILAFVLCISNGPLPKINNFIPEDPWGTAGLAFIIPLMGWMPTALDLSSWNSLWTVERIKQTGYHPTMKETLFDFNFGYIISAILAVVFLTLGAYLLNGTGIETPKQSDLFASHVIKLYTNVIGDWSYIIIASATFSIMFGTCIAVFDGYARSLKKTIQLIMKKNDVSEKKELKLYRTNLVFVMTGALLLIWKFEDSGDFGILVNIATIISFMIAPVVAIFNFTLVKEKYIGKESTPPIWLKILSYLGIIFLIGFSIFYITQLI
jgi:Mn2+/Fe2+ NRAMP family transporter